MAKEIKVKDETIKEIIKTDLDRAKRWQDDLRPLREQNFLLYSMSKEANGIRENNRVGFSQSVSPLIYQSVEGMKVVLDPIITSPDFFAVEIADNTEAGERIRKLLRWNIFEAQYGARELRYWLDTTLKYEYGILKTYWNEEYHEKREKFKELDYQQAEELLANNWKFEEGYEQVFDYQPSMELDGSMGFQPVTVGLKNVKAIHRTPKFIGVKIESVDPEVFYYSPDSAELDKCRLVAQKVFMRAEDIKRGEKTGQYRKGSYKKALEARVERDNYYDDVQYRYDTSDLENPLENIDITMTPENEPNKPLVVWEIYVNIDIDNDGYTEPVIVHQLENGEIISIQENVYKRPPFRISRAIESPYRFEGVPYPQSLAQLQKEITQQQRLFNDATADSVYGNLITSDTQLATSWNERVVGGILLASKPTMKDQDYAIVRSSGADPAILQAKEMLENQGEQISGITRYNQGIDADSLNSTATGISIISSMAQQKQKYMANVISETFKDMLEDMVEVFKLFGSQYIEYFVRKGNEINVEDYANDFSINIELGIGSQEKQQQASVLRELIALGQNGGIQAGLMNLGHIAKALDRIGDLTGTPLEQFHYSAEEIEQQQAMKQQQAQMQAQQMAQQQAIMNR